MNPLQERANFLRETFQKQAAEEKGYQQHHKQTVQEQVVQMFAADFTELYQLLLQSQIYLEGAVTNQGKQVVLSSDGKQLSIFFEGVKNSHHTWRFYGKDYLASSKESENQLIIALAEAFSQAQSKQMPGK